MNRFITAQETIFTACLPHSSLGLKEAKNTISLSDEDKSAAIEILQLYQNVDSLELNVSIRENDIVLKEFQFG